MPRNILGLCPSHHRWVHHPSSSDIDPESGCVLTGVEWGNKWLADQIESAPVRVDSVRRSALLDEVVAATTSPDALRYHQSSVYDRNCWNTYEVFLKAALVYLDESGRARSPEACIVLLRMVDLYRRRPGKHYRTAAVSCFRSLELRFDAIKHETSIVWIEGQMKYHGSYLEFLVDSASRAVLAMFEESASVETAAGRVVGALISSAQALVVRQRLGLPFAEVRDGFAQLSDRFCAIEDLAGDRWLLENI